MKGLVRRLLSLALGLSCLAASSRASAETTVELAAPDAATCVSQAELVRAVRSAGLDAGSAASAADRVDVRVEGTPSELTVVVRRAGAELSQRLAPATCETATDVVAAFIVSALSPAPVVPTGPPPSERPRLDPRALDAAVREELSLRDIDLKRRRVELAFFREASGSFGVRATNPYPLCARTIDLGPIAALGVLELRRVTDAVVDGVDAVGRCKKVSPDVVRAGHLRRALDDVERSTRRAEQAAAIEIFAGTLVAGILVVTHELSHDPEPFFASSDRTLIATGSAIWVVGGTTALLASDNVRAPVVRATNAASVGFVWGSFWVDQHPDYVANVFVAGGLSTAWLLSLDAMVRPAPVSRLRAARRELATGTTPSRKRMRALERDLRATEPLIPDWVSYAPIVGAGAIGIVASFEEPGRTDALLISVGYVTSGLLPALMSSPHSRYRETLESSGLTELSLGPGPGDRGGLTLSGKF